MKQYSRDDILDILENRVAKVGTETFRSNELNASPKQVFKQMRKSHEIAKRLLLREELDQQVDVTVRTSRISPE